MVVVRPAVPTDAQGIRRVATTAYHETYVDVIGTDAVETLLDAWYDPDDLRDRLGGDGTTTYVALTRDQNQSADGDGDERVDDDDDTDGSGRVVGYAGALVSAEETSDGDDGPVGHLPTLYVHPDRWGEGIGSRLFERARTHVARRGADRMRISVFADNEVGRAFYERRADLIEERAERVGPLDSPVSVAVYEAPVE